ncbi:MAG: hypothetical protein AAFR57_12905, partial [Pseudomonadota bacterium]
MTKHFTAFVLVTYACSAFLFPMVLGTLAGRTVNGNNYGAEVVLIMLLGLPVLVVSYLPSRFIWMKLVPEGGADTGRALIQGFLAPTPAAALGVAIGLQGPPGLTSFWPTMFVFGGIGAMTA